jgi:hypothetical protein
MSRLNKKFRPANKQNLKVEKTDQRNKANCTMFSCRQQPDVPLNSEMASYCLTGCRKKISICIIFSMCSPELHPLMRKLWLGFRDMAGYDCVHLNLQKAF